MARWPFPFRIRGFAFCYGVARLFSLGGLCNIMPNQFQSVFERLRDILKKHAVSFSAVKDASDHYSLEAPVGPATLQALGGKMRSPMIPVAWVQMGKAYVSFHIMGVYGNPKLLDDCSKELRAHMQGKSCFNFKTVDETLFVELEQLTIQSFAGMKKAGFVDERT